MRISDWSSDVCSSDLKCIAERVAYLTAFLRASLVDLGYSVAGKDYFDTLLLDTGAHTQAVIQAAESASINLRRAGTDQVAVSLDETVTVEDVHALLAVFAQAVGKPWDASAKHALPAHDRRGDV